MKRTALVMVAFLSLSGGTYAAQAEATKNLGPEFINLKMGVMLAPFPHRKHQQSLNNECWHCHKTTSGTIDGWGKETAHTLCIPCHDMEEKGPVQCQQCHHKTIEAK